MWNERLWENACDALRDELAAWIYERAEEIIGGDASLEIADEDVGSIQRTLAEAHRSSVPVAA